MMKRRGALCALFALLAVFATALTLTAQTPQPAPKDTSAEAKALLAKSLELFGGKEKLAAVTNLRMTVAMKVFNTPQGEMDMDGEITVVLPNKQVVKMNSPMGEIRIVNTPDLCFMAFGPNVRDMPPEASASTSEAFSHGEYAVLLHLDDPAYHFALGEKDTIDGVTVQIISITLNGKSFSYYVDPATGHVLRVDDVAMTETGPAKQITYFSEWKKVGGFDTAMHIVVKQDGETVRSMDMKNIEYNVTVDPALFQKPAA
jgi:hypothetical protein